MEVGQTSNRETLIMKAKSKALGLLALASLATTPYVNAYENIMDESRQPYAITQKSPLSKKAKKRRSKNKIAKQSRKKNRK